MMVSKLQEENQRLLKDHSPDKYLSSALSEPVIDGEMIQRLKNNLEKQRDEIREKERQYQDKCSENENVSENNLFLNCQLQYVILVAEISNRKIKYNQQGIKAKK